MTADNTATVDLSHKNLTEVPEEGLLKCHDIWILDLSRNPGILLNNSLRRFSNVRKLVLSQCALPKIPDEISELSKLEELDVTWNNFSEGLNPVIGKLRRLKSLNIGHCRLKNLPDCIGDLQQLEELDVSGNNFSDTHNAAVLKLRGLKKLGLTGCRLMTIPDWMTDLEGLQDLNVSHNNFALGLNSSLGRLSELKKLDLSFCKLKTLPDVIGDLQLLEELNFRCNNASDGLGPAIGRLHQLKKLNLYSCELKNLPDTIGDLELLEELDVTENKFTDGLNLNVGRLHRLKELRASHCDLTSLPDWIGELKLLEDLALSGNRFSDGGLNPAITRLPLLKKLDLSFCGLATLPDWMGDLEQLTHLQLGDNKFKEYPICTLHLKSLQNLDLSNEVLENANCIVHLPPELAYSNLVELGLSGNQIKDPPKEVWSRGLEAIKSFMREVIPGGSFMHADTINVIGDTGAGKTSLIRSMIAQTAVISAEAEPTQVVEQLRTNICETGFSVNINDFGGLEIYHYSISLFWPNNGLVLLVVDMADERREDTVRKWLLTVTARNREIRVIIVGTHADQMTNDGQRSYFEEQMTTLSSSVLRSATDVVNSHIDHIECALMNGGMHDKLKSLCRLRDNLRNATVHVVTFSCSLDDKRLAELRGLVVNLLRPPETLPFLWCRIINDILKRGLCNLYITMKEVKDIYQVYFSDTNNSKTLTTILQYLSKTSRIIWFEEHSVLRNFVFPSPHKLIELCKNVFHLGSEAFFTLPLPCMNAQEEYEKGFLRQPLLQNLISLHMLSGSRSKVQDTQDVHNSRHSDAIAKLLQDFNLVSYVLEDAGKQFVVPFKLRLTAPRKLQEFESIGNRCLNRVIVRLSFLGSTIPISLFETFLSSMLTLAGELARHYVYREVWKDGILILHDRVYFMAKRFYSAITLTAFSEPSVYNPGPWTILQPVLKRLSDNVLRLWSGLPPRCAIVCPSCTRRNRSEHSNIPVGEFRTDITTLNTLDARDKARPTCKECMKTIPRSLCFPSVESGSFTSDQKEIEEFFKNLDEEILRPVVALKQPSYDVNWALVSEEHALKVLQLSHLKLIKHLAWKHVAHFLFRHEMIHVLDYESIQVITEPVDGRNRLLKAVTSRSVEGLRCFLEALLDTQQTMLYENVTTTLYELVPDSFRRGAPSSTRTTNDA